MNITIDFELKNFWFSGLWEDIKFYEGNLVLCAFSSEIIRKSFTSENINKDPLEHILEVDLIENKLSLRERNLLKFHVRVRDLIWKTILFQNPYKQFFEDGQNISELPEAFNHERLEIARQ